MTSIVQYENRMEGERIHHKVDCPLPGGTLNCSDNIELWMLAR